MKLLQIALILILTSCIPNNTSIDQVEREKPVGAIDSFFLGDWALSRDAFSLSNDVVTMRYLNFPIEQTETVNEKMLNVYTKNHKFTIKKISSALISVKLCDRIETYSCQKTAFYGRR